MPSESSEEPAAQQRLGDAYRCGNQSMLVLALPPAQQLRFCRAVIAQAQAECARVLPYLERRGDRFRDRNRGAMAVFALFLRITSGGKKPTLPALQIPQVLSLCSTFVLLGRCPVFRYDSAWLAV